MVSELIKLIKGIQDCKTRAHRDVAIDTVIPIAAEIERELYVAGKQLHKVLGFIESLEVQCCGVGEYSGVYGEPPACCEKPLVVGKREEMLNMLNEMKEIRGSGE